MSRSEHESSQHGKLSDGSENSMIHVHVGSYQLTAADREQLQRLADRPDREIDFSDIPRLTPEEFEEAKRLVAAQRSAKLKKAS